MLNAQRICYAIHSKLVIKLKSSHSTNGWYMRDDFVVFENVLCSDIMTEMVEHKIRLFTWALSHVA